jgi:hypothetical protein
VAGNICVSLACGIEAVKFFAMQSLFAVTVLECVDYVEHYGLTRALKSTAAGTVTRAGLVTSIFRVQDSV